MDSSISRSKPALHAVFVLVRSEYWTADVSRYRLGITKETLIPSLQAQTARFDCLLQACPADPFWSERVEMFQPLNTWPWWELKNCVWRYGWPYLLVEIPDDLILPANAIARLRAEAEAILTRDNGHNPCYLNCQRGGVWQNGIVRQLQIDVGSLPVRVKLVRSKIDKAAFKADIGGGELWYQPVHQQMDSHLPSGWEQQPEIAASCIDHVKPRILSMYANAKIVTGTAENATVVLPRRTKSMYFLQERRGRRR